MRLPPRAKTAALVVPFAAYAIYAAARSELRVDHVLLAAVAAGLALAGERARRLLVALFPLGLVAVMYDAMRPFRNVGLTESRVLLCGLHSAEARLFGEEAG